MTGVEFDISKWAAWAPGLTTEAAWRSWARAPSAPVGDDLPALPEVPALTRRRMDRLGRLAFEVAHRVQGERRGLPLVFASRHGAATHSFELMVDSARALPVSPMRFALSVHNAIGSQYAITRGDEADVVAVGNGLFTPEAGLFEAVTLAPESVLVVYDGSPHALLAPFFPGVAGDFAFAWHVKRGGPWRVSTADVTPTPTGGLPHALALLRFVLNREARYRVADGVSGFEWSRRPAPR